MELFQGPSILSSYREIPIKFEGRIRFDFKCIVPSPEFKDRKEIWYSDGTMQVNYFDGRITFGRWRN